MLRSIITAGRSCLLGNRTAWASESRDGRMGGELGEGMSLERFSIAGTASCCFEQRPLDVLSPRFPHSSELLQKPHPSRFLSGVACRKPQPASEVQNNCRRVCVVKNTEPSARRAKHQLCASAFTPTCPSSSKVVPKDRVACTDSTAIANAHYHALLALEA